jgi:hypothetical protein
MLHTKEIAEKISTMICALDKQTNANASINIHQEQCHLKISGF